MAVSEAQRNVSRIAGSTFAKTDLYKFLSYTTDATVVIGPSTASGAVGTLLSVTGTTSGAGVESVTMGLLEGDGKVFLAASTLDAGNLIAASSDGAGIAPTTDAAALGTLIDGSSGTTGRIGTVHFHRSADV